ncbi:M56 family metallopeptidase [Frateuria sp. Soil773]|uniref:M56 family metallopeptidase n=1 Tax=Frateuria sp. Soil773 TaxID=1736407 RepID=UPI001F29B423|nr:M56 family metallopeptidase [Frateuria sp. Soil773]
MLLAFSVAVLVVAALRRPCRRLFGAEAAFRLWLLPALAMLASQLPHADAPAAALPSMVIAVASVASALPASAVQASAIDWRAGIVVAWLAGIALSLLQAVLAQSRYRARLRGAAVVRGASPRLPVLRAAGMDVGPALVGAWRPRIVLPADFDRRYDEAERALILAHETMHARRGDGWWCLCARIAAALFWFHPLAWWALAALRHDQELACDAAVLRQHGARRRSYATAMLKTPSAALALPMGCTWSPRHPLTERIAMLKAPAPDRRRRHAGAIAGLALALVVGGSVYAASAPQGKRAAPPVPGAEYQLDMQIELTKNDSHGKHSEAAALALCMAPGKAATAIVDALKVEATAKPAADGQVSVDLAVTGAGTPPRLVRERLHGALGQALHAAAEGSYAIDVTPQAGCPARTIAGASPVKVSERVTNGTARAAAESIAAKAGWTLVNPDALGDAAVTLSFNGMPAGTALQQVASLAGVKWTLEGSKVRFMPK